MAYLLPAALLADAAYSDEKDFRDLTGIQDAKLVDVAILNAQVCEPYAGCLRGFTEESSLPMTDCQRSSA